MSKVFVEYRIAEERKSDFLAFIETRREADSFGIFEGTEQPGLYVEIWDGLSEAAYREWKRKRLEDSASPWRAMDDMVDGGNAKVHIWHFTEIA